MFFEPQEHPLAWQSRKQYKSSFRDRFTCHSETKNNTPLFYDGSAEAREILSNAMGMIVENPKSEDWRALGILGTALDHLKGKDIRDNFSYTREFFTDLVDWVEAQQDAAKPELLSIAPAPQTEVYRDDTCIQRLKDEPKTPTS
jgi:hypothetical protein